MTQQNKMHTQLSQELQQVLKKAQIPVSNEAQEKLVAYLLLLQEWNQVHNLSGITDPVEMVTRHLLDSLVVEPYLHGNRILDVGTGAGLPGIPLAIVRPDLSFTLLDSNQKKIHFVTHVILSLKLKNAAAVAARVEQYRPDTLFDCVISRAFASLPIFVETTCHLTNAHGMLCAMKGPNHEMSQINLPKGYEDMDIQEMTVPGLSGKRYVIRVSKVAL